MRTGLVLGKFMPPHKGHLALIDFALQHCDELILLLCYHEKEPIKGEQRRQWLDKIYEHHLKIKLYSFSYDPDHLPDSSESSVAHSAKWANVIRDMFPDVSLIFSSEKYGEYLADLLEIQHIGFDYDRNFTPISATQIRRDPFQYWEYIPDLVRPFFVKKVGILGSESTGKSTLTEHLARHFRTSFVPETARDIVSQTEECTLDQLPLIATAHAQEIIKQERTANKILFCDTDINITKSYARFLFNHELIVPEWIERANHFHLYLYLETDCPFVQDGTRLNEQERNRLDAFHKHQLTQATIDYVSIRGNWDQRFDLACALVEKHLMK